MKGAAVSRQNCQGSHWYCISWKRVNGSDRFRHWVLAESIDHAISRSRLNVSKALGTNADLWNVEEPGDNATRGILTEVVWQSEGPRSSSHRVRIIASVLILLCLLFLFTCSSCEVIRDPPSGGTEQRDKPQLCTLLMASQRSILESMFEVELYSVNYRTDEWHAALKSIEVATTDASGHTLSPGLVLQSTIDKLVQVQNPADRMRLEYLLLGSRMSLKERRQFDDYCVAAAP